MTGMSRALFLSYASQDADAAQKIAAALRGESWHWPVEPGAWLALTYLVLFGSLIAFNAYMLLLA